MNELIKIDQENELVSELPELKPMIKDVKQFLPELSRAMGLFGKRQSQFMDKVLTVSQPTPLRRLRQIAAECTKSITALKEVHGKILKKKAELEILKDNLDNENCFLKQDLIKAEIVIKENEIEASRPYVAGAIKKVASYQAEYSSMQEKFNLVDYSEADFEREEEKYHIMTAFSQGVCAARTRGGLIDEGNMIYLTQIGINGASAQFQVNAYLTRELNMMKEGMEPSMEMYDEWLECMYLKYKGCVTKVNQQKGMNLDVNTQYTIG